MPQIDLSTMSGPELRQLLDSSRRRGDAPLSYKVLQEMAARRETGAERGRSARRKHSEPRLVAVDLGEPMDEPDDLPPMPNWRPPPPEPEAPAAAAPAPAPEPELEPAAAPDPAQRRSRRKAPPADDSGAAPALRLRDPDPEPAGIEAATPATETPEAWDLRLRPAEPRPPPRRRSGMRGAAIFALGAVLGVGLGWWASGLAREGASPLAPAGSVGLSALTPAPAARIAPPAASVTEPAAVTPADAVAPPRPAEPSTATAATSPPNAQDAAGDADGKAPEDSSPTPAAPRIAEAVKTDEPSARPSACAAEPTPADREICGDADLRRLQRELQRAYAQALAAHQDRALLRQRQLAWRDARSEVADPGRLARLYQDRIRKLNAAAAEARRER